VHHRLAGRLAGVEANVVAGGVELLVELPLHEVDEVKDCELFLAPRLEPVADDASGDDERVALGDREHVANREREGVRCDPLALWKIEEYRAHWRWGLYHSSRTSLVCSHA
jgi:hypothetical protein